VQPDPKLIISPARWQALLAELHRRTEGRHESGAFLLGTKADSHRQVEQVVYYDELDPDAYRSGVVILHAASFGPLWDICRARGLSVVADVHVHPKQAFQSEADRQNPMIARAGHLALIVPWFARPPVGLESLGFFEYLGSHQWRDFSGRAVTQSLIIKP
jgi:proteasome lid subunit RPN8/RPN11